MQSKNIFLNFMELSNQNFDIKIFILEFDNDKLEIQTDDIRRRQINGSDYFVSFEKFESSREITINSKENLNITKNYLHHEFISHLRNLNIDFYSEDKRFDKYISFPTQSMQYGKKTIELRPYYLKSKEKFGFLIDFSFIPNELGKQNRRECLIQDGTLDKYGKSNRDNYNFKSQQIQNFLKGQFQNFRTFQVGNTSITVSDELFVIDSGSLNKKTYLFSSRKKDYSQFMGIKRHGVYQPVLDNVKYIFLYAETHRTFVIDLYKCLLGELHPETFSGLKFFGLKFSKEQVDIVKIKNESLEELKTAVENIKRKRAISPSEKLIVIYVEQTRDETLTSAESPYYFIKYNLIKEKIPLQVINYTARSQTNALKWSASNIGLQIFAKLGGIPWIVEPTNEDCLILGIGSSHKRDTDGKINKYFAYSVCLDASGIYKTLEILAEGNEKDNYIAALKSNIIALLSKPEYSFFKKCVLHLPFKIKNIEIAAITSALKEVHGIEFKVIKINTDNKFFGFSQHNTKVPYESTFVSLSAREYLVWFQGLQYGKELVTERIANPVHIEFLKLDHFDQTNDSTYLQDVINLSGANWRGFNAKLEPISIYYAHLVAVFSKAFEDFDDFDEKIFQTTFPWFL